MGRALESDIKSTRTTQQEFAAALLAESLQSISQVSTTEALAKAGQVEAFDWLLRWLP
ncbi:MAG: hypothetical protein U0361_21555 [Nitrospiraceae bacterium]